MSKTDSILLIVSSPLTEPNGSRALELANQFRLQGKKTGVYLLQNAVLCVLVDEVKTLIETHINMGIDFYCLEEDLIMRGFKKKDLLSNILLSDYSDLIDLMMERHDKVIGLF